MRTRLVVVDSSPLLYRNYYGATRNLRTSKGMKSGGMFGFLKSFLSLKERFKESYFLFTFDGGDSGRRELYSGYKPLVEKEEKHQAFYRQLKHVELFLQSVGVPTLHYEGLEADDLISIAAAQWVERHPLYNAIIISSDRDFFQCLLKRVMLYDDRAKTFYGPTEVEKLLGIKFENFLFYKCLLGDSSDNIPGMPGFGKIKAAEFSHIGPHIVEGQLFLDFQRNMRLMKLPKSFEEMECLNKKTIDKYTLDMHNWFTGMEEGGHVKVHERAQKMLDYYEIRSLGVEDFL
jgi:DNA polymerase-1